MKSNPDIICLTRVEPGELCKFCGDDHETHERNWRENIPAPVTDEYREKILASLR